MLVFKHLGRVFKWDQDQTKTTDVHQNAEQVAAQVEQASLKRSDQSQDLLKMLAIQQELLEAQQKQINLLTDLVKNTGQTSPATGFHQQGRGQGQFQPRHP